MTSNFKLFKNSSNKEQLSIISITLINFLFTAKYSERVTSYYPLIALIVGLGTYSFLIYRRKLLQNIQNGRIKHLTLFLILFFIIGSAILFNYYPVQKLNVDRWSVISSFWESVESGNFGYLAKSHMGNAPGPMPFYFILAYPFYLMGELGYFSILGLIVFLCLILHAFSKEQRNSNLLITSIFLIASPFFLWEVVSRSNIFLNGTLVVIALNYFLSNNSSNNIQKLLVSGVLLGLFLSMRNVFAIVYIIAFIYALRTKLYDFKQLFFIGLIAIMTFIITFLPFTIGHFDEFMKINPFIIEGTALVPFNYTLGFMGLAIVTSFSTKNYEDVLFYSGLVLFVSIFIYFVYHISLEGFHNSFYGSRADISYFIFCIPFFLFYLLKTKEIK